MARILFAWELGGQLGHATTCNALARTLRDRGHHIAFVFRELAPLAYLDCAAHDVFQAPVSLTEGQGAGTPASIADILLGCGFGKPRHAAGLLGAWIALFERWRPDLVACDFSPTALLAARLLGLRRVTQGNGFQIPPRLTPIPAFRFDDLPDPKHLLAAEAQSLANANEAIVRLGASSPLESLAQMFEADEDFLGTFPELDAYGNRPASGYWGPSYDIETGMDVAWPGGEGKRVAIYVRKTLEHLDTLIAALRSQGLRVAAFIPDLEPARAALLAGPGRVVCERPMRLGPLLRDCDLFISHGGNACVGTLLAGVPQLVFPAQYEQYITARRIAQLGVGTWLGPANDPAEVAATLARMVGDAALKAAASAYAQRYAGYTPREQARRIIMRMEEILAAPPRWKRSIPARADAILAPTSQGRGPDR